MNNQKLSPPLKEGIENNDKIITEDKNYEFDDLLRLTGQFGRYQMALYAFICLVSIPTGAQLGIPVFYGISPRLLLLTARPSLEMELVQRENAARVAWNTISKEVSLVPCLR